MNLTVADKRVLITGGTRGIGRTMVIAFADCGARVVTCGRSDSPQAASLAQRLGTDSGRHAVVAADVTADDDVVRLAATCHEVLGGLDVIVNNVGVDGTAPLGAQVGGPPDGEWPRVLSANLTAAYMVLHATLPDLADGGSVINMGASVALRGRPGSAHYTASKSALIGLTRSLARELGPRGIRVNTVAPGVIADGPDGGPPPETAARLARMIALGRLGTPAEVASAVLFLASDLSRYISGITLNVDGGI